MERLLFFLFLLSIQPLCYSQHDGQIVSREDWRDQFRKNQTDTLNLYDEFNHVTYQVIANDYFQQIQKVFPDSISNAVIAYITDKNSAKKEKHENPSIDADYYLSLSFYDRPQGLTFDHVLHDLFVDGKLILLRGEKHYTAKQVRIKSKRVYCCHNPLLYCGKDWFVYDGMKLLTTFSKSVTSKTYVMRSCF